MEINNETDLKYKTRVDVFQYSYFAQRKGSRHPTRHYHAIIVDVVNGNVEVKHPNTLFTRRLLFFGHSKKKILDTL